MRLSWLIVCLLLPTLAWANPEQSPDPVTILWDYSPEAEAALVNGGFNVYRELGDHCAEWFMDWDKTDANGVVAPTVTVPSTAREAVDATIPPDHTGEVCYEATAFTTVPAGDPTMGTYQQNSLRSVRVGFHRLAGQTWWGDTVKLDVVP
jgi:hypothetical protein